MKGARRGGTMPAMPPTLSPLSVLVLGVDLVRDDPASPPRLEHVAPRWAIYEEGADEPLRTARGHVVVIDAQTWFAARALARTYTAAPFEVRRFAPERPPERAELVSRVERSPSDVRRRRFRLVR